MTVNPLTCRASAEAIEQFGDDLAKLQKAFDKLCRFMPSSEIDWINRIPDQDKLDTIAKDFQALGDRLSRDCDAAEEVEDRRRDNPLERDYRRLGQ